MKQYCFLDEGLIKNFFHDRSLCIRASNLRQNVQDECIRQIRKIKNFYRQHRIDTKTYKFLLAQQHNKLATLELRLSKLDL